MINGITATIPIAYGICVLFSAVVLICYLRFVKEKHIWLLLMIISVFVVNVGYLCLSLSPTLNHALMANRIAYLGNVFQPVFMLLTVANLCRVEIKKPLAAIMLGFSSAMLISAFTMGVLPWFYKTVDYAVVDGVVKLIKTYGMLHSVYIAYVVILTLAVITITIHSIVHKKLVFYRYIIMVVFISSTNVVVWLAEQFARGNYELLSASYIFTCVLLVLLYAEFSENGLLDSYKTVIETIPGEQKAPVESIETDENTSCEIDFNNSETLTNICNYYAENKILTKRETEVLALILQGYNRKTVSEKLFITENTTKTHFSKIYEKLEVSGKKELKQKINENAAGILEIE